MPRPQNLSVRNKLLVAGQQLVRNQGFNGCGVQDITTEAGVPKGSFYNYFESKEALACEIVKEYWQSIEEQIGPLLYDARVKPIDRVYAFFNALVEEHALHDFTLGCLIGNLALELSNTSPEARGQLSSLFKRWQSVLSDCLKEAQVRRELTDEYAADGLAAILIEAWEGAIMRSKVERTDVACRRFIDFVLPRWLA